MLYTADFETTTDPNDCRVWACGISTIDKNHTFNYGNSMEWFIEFAMNSDGDTFYFHNLGFDGVFIILHLFKIGYKHIEDRKQLNKGMFTTLISDKGQFYSMNIVFENGAKVEIIDSFKLLPMSVERVAKGFDLPISKLDLDYKEYREVGHELTELEVDYLRNDVEIMSRALLIMFEQGLDKMTLGSSAMAEYKKLVGGKKFLKWFPPPVYDGDIRQSYKGGFTYCDPRVKGKDIGEGIVLDVNSLYPSVMYYSPLPYGEGISFDGEYVKDKVYNLYIQMVTCQFKLKPNYIPTIQIKGNLSFVPTDYLSDSGEEEVTLCLTNVDLEMFFEHYEVYNITYHGGWKFKSTTGLFKDYIDKWNKIKMESTLNGNESMRTIAKLMLNNIYGKFALNPRVQSKIPYSHNGKLKFRLGEVENREPIYIPVGTFITAWARHKTITSAQKVYDRFCYADTDSLHLIGTELPECLEIDEVKLGAWKLEGKFTRARFIRQKTYIEEFDGKLSVVCAGMPYKCHQYVTWENFHEGSAYKGSLKSKKVEGGVVLLDGEFKIERRK